MENDKARYQKMVKEGRKEMTWRTTVFGRVIYRITGVVVYLAIIQIARG